LKGFDQQAEMLQFRGALEQFGLVRDCFEELRQLIKTPTLPDLGPDARSGTESAASLNTKLDATLRESKTRSEDQQLIRALILLWHDDLDAAHTLAQDVEGPDGAFVHGIMHRREPDYGNAAYWFRRVGEHAAFPEIGKRAASLPEIKSTPKVYSSLFTAAGWDPFAFINLCQQYARTSEPIKPVLQQIQAIETEILLQHFSQ
jgi:hypothetical protein